MPSGASRQLRSRPGSYRFARCGEGFALASSHRIPVRSGVVRIQCGHKVDRGSSPWEEVPSTARTASPPGRRRRSPGSRRLPRRSVAARRVRWTTWLTTSVPNRPSRIHLAGVAESRQLFPGLPRRCSRTRGCGLRQLPSRCDAALRRTRRTRTGRQQVEQDGAGAEERQHSEDAVTTDSHRGMAPRWWPGW